jgi:serine phosphatase RsbU (regulator of sigma subunit)
VLKWTQAFFMAFTMRLTPARRAIYGVALLSAAFGVVSLFRGISVFGVPIVIPPFFFRIGVPTLAFQPGTNWLIFAFAAMNLLVLLEVFDRLSLKRDLEVAREIQLAMLPDGTWAAPGVEASGLTRPANTVGGDFYDILPRTDGRVIVALGDVAGKASPAALLMALFLAMLRTLVDEDLPLAELARRLNIQVSKHAPPSRFITLFLGLFDPRTGQLEFVNAGQTPPLLLRAGGSVERLSTGGVALAMFEGSTYEPGYARLDPGDALIMYSDGITEAESPAGQMFDESGLEAAVRATPGVSAAVIGRAVFRAVDDYRRGERLADDLTVLVLSRPIVPPVPPLVPSVQNL